MNKKGFTLIELLAVIVILGIVVAIAIPGINSVISNSRKKSLKSEVGLIHSAAMRKYASQPETRFSTINKGNLKEHLEIDGSIYDYVHISNNKEKIAVTIKKDGYTATTDGKESTSFNLPPFIAFEYDLSLGQSFLNINDTDLATQTVYVYNGTFEENKENINKGFKNIDYELTNLKYNDDLRTILNKTTGIITVIATKMSSTGSTKTVEGRIRNHGLIRIPHFDIIELNIKTLNFMFHYAINFNQDISHWDVSEVRYMSYMFDGASIFNQNINSWNTKNLLSTYAMFRNMQSYNQPLNNWDVSKITSFGSMFWNCKSFNQNISNWDTKSALSMYYMFYRAENFSQDISNWNVSQVTDTTNFSLSSGLLPEQLPNFN